jgi:hypothetical protein
MAGQKYARSIKVWVAIWTVRMLWNVNYLIHKYLRSLEKLSETEIIHVILSML